MKYGNIQVEQILSDGTIEKGCDISLSPTEITNVLCNHFPNLKVAGAKPTFYVGEYQGHKYAIRCKNVTYLGNPHPYYKKRIQIAEDLYAFYDAAIAIGATPLLLGVYTYKDNILFVDFKIDTYIQKMAHNSSAHVYVSDLSAAAEEGFFQKTDAFHNRVTAFRPDNISVFLDDYFETSESPIKCWGTEVSSECIKSDSQIFKKEIVPQIKNFFRGVDKKWHGIECYKKMIASGYRNKFQPEWVGFFLEFAFADFLKDNHLESMITYYQDKSSGGIDLDLYFPQVKCFGDLKAHSEDSRGIQGNDWETIFSILNKRDETSHIYYIVCEHATEKDSGYDYEVTKFWNTMQKKKDLLSYHKRMKNNVVLKKVYILDINYNNKDYLTMFKQGINSNGKPRAPKIMIEHDNLKHFILEEINL